MNVKITPNGGPFTERFNVEVELEGRSRTKVIDLHEAGTQAMAKLRAVVHYEALTIVGEMVDEQMRGVHLSWRLELRGERRVAQRRGAAMCRRNQSLGPPKDTGRWSFRPFFYGRRSGNDRRASK